MIETLNAYHFVYSKRDKVKMYIPNDVNKSILNKLKDLVNSISLIEKINGQSKKVNQRMNSLKSERVMSMKKEYESEICPTFSKPK